MNDLNEDRKYRIPRKQIEKLVNDYYTNPIMRLSFGISNENCDEIRDKELIRQYVENFYLMQERGK